jgi:hypothetical protein
VKKKKLDKKNPHIKERLKENPKVDANVFTVLIEESTKHKPFDKKK